MRTECELDALLRDQLPQVADDRRVAVGELAQPCSRIGLGHGLVVRCRDRIERRRVPPLERPLDQRVGDRGPAAGRVGVACEPAGDVDQRLDARAGPEGVRRRPRARRRDRGRASPGRGRHIARAPRCRIRAPPGRRRAPPRPDRGSDPAHGPRTRGHCRGSWPGSARPPAPDARSRLPGSRGPSRRSRCPATRQRPAARRRSPADSARAPRPTGRGTGARRRSLRSGRRRRPAASSRSPVAGVRIARHPRRGSSHAPSARSGRPRRSGRRHRSTGGARGDAPGTGARRRGRLPATLPRCGQ